MSGLSYLRSLQALELAARLGSLKAAAAALAITPAAAGQRIRALESYLGIDLLVRGRSGLRATPALEAALEPLALAFRQLEVVSERLDLQRGFELHIAAASDFAELWLKRRLPEFRAQHPNIRFCINGEGDAPLRIGPADCEISFGPARPGADLLFRDFVLPLSSPENTERISRLSRRDRLEGFPLLHLDFYRDDPAVPSWPQWIKAQRLHRTAPERGIRFKRITAVEEALLANAGIALCGLALLSEAIDGAQLSLPFPLSTGSWSRHAFHARFRPESLSRSQVRRFREWLSAQSGVTRQWLAARTGRRMRRPASDQSARSSSSSAERSPRSRSSN